MATYKQIQDYIKEKHGFCVKTCWIADMKEKNGIAVRTAHNRQNSTKRVYPCPNDKQKVIIEAFKYFNML